MAGLYWRVNGSNYEALECILRGYLYAPPQHKDILLHQLASILYRFDQVEHSIELLRMALEIRETEAATYYAMGNSLVARGNQTGAIEFYSYALYLKSDFQEPFQCLFVTKCALKRKEASLPLSDDTVPQGDDSVFWEKSWKVSFNKTQYMHQELLAGTMDQTKSWLPGRRRDLESRDWTKTSSKRSQWTRTHNSPEYTTSKIWQTGEVTCSTLPEWRAEQ